MEVCLSFMWHWFNPFHAVWFPCLASIMPKRNRNFYAVRCGRNPGIYESWEDCKHQVDGFQGNQYKSFSTRSEAEDYVKESLKCSEISTNPKNSSSQSPKLSPILQCKPSTMYSETEKEIKDLAKSSQNSVSLEQASSLSLPVSPSAQSKLCKLIEEKGERFAVFDSITDFDMFFDFLGRSSNEKDERQNKRLKDSKWDREEQMHVRDRSEASKDNTSASSAKFVKAQQKSQHEINKMKLTREYGEFVYFQDETELEIYLAPYRKIDDRSDFVKKSPVSQTFDGAESCEYDGVYQVEFDGASKGNPGKSGAGALLRCPHGSVVWTRMEFLGYATNNVAEYSALILGLKGAVSRGIRKVRAQSDSQLVCLQVLGVWSVKDEKLIPLFNAVEELKKCFEEFSIIHVYREFNSTADALANGAVRLEGSELMLEVIEPIPKCCQS